MSYYFNIRITGQVHPSISSRTTEFYRIEANNPHDATDEAKIRFKRIYQNAARLYANIEAIEENKISVTH